MASFWDKAGGAAKWITDPKQLLTAAGFALGGPVGAGVGRAVGGIVPQSAGPVPWGALGADTDEFRHSTLADGLQWEDVGQAGKDFASGYSAGQVGQQIPGLRDLEGAFAGGAEAGQSMGVDALMKDNPDFMPTPDLGSGVSSVGAPPMAQQSMGGPVYANPPMSAGRVSMYQGIDYFGGGGGDLTMRGTPLALNQTTRAAEVMDLSSPMRQPNYGTPDYLGSRGLNNLKVPPPQYPAPGDEGNFLSGAWSRAGDVLGGARSSFDDLTPMEKMYVASQVPGIAGAITGAGGGQPIGEEGTALLGEMGMFSPTQRRRPTNFDEWRSQRSRR